VRKQNRSNGYGNHYAANLLLRLGEEAALGLENRETVKTVPKFFTGSFTGLKPGENERAAKHLDEAR
jgi:hypothetical protein